MSSDQLLNDIREWYFCLDGSPSPSVVPPKTEPEKPRTPPVSGLLFFGYREQNLSVLLGSDNFVRSHTNLLALKELNHADRCL